jgi:hypothetical protein
MTLIDSAPTSRNRLPALRSDVLDEDEAPDNPGYLTVEALHKQVQNYLTNKQAEIEEQKEGRRYYHCAQWTASELEILRKRNQAVITFNRISRKINQITGIVQRNRQDPKAYPRTPKYEQGAEVATQVVREILDANEWQSTESDCIRRAGFEAIAGIEFDLVKGDHDDPDVSMRRARAENYFYDYHSLDEDFSDKTYDGMMKWMHLENVIEMFPGQEEELRAMTNMGSDLSSNPDSDNKLFFIGAQGMIRLIEHWYKHKGRWCWCFYVGFHKLQEGESPFFDEKGESQSRFKMFSNSVDQDGDRYSFVRNLRGPQDEMNHRRSSGLYRSVSRQIEVVKGAVDDVEVARRERGKPDGVIERNPGDGNAIKYIDQSADIAAQRSFWEDARDEIQNWANIDAAGMAGITKNLSGRAISALQQPGMAELEPFLNTIKRWRLQVYRMAYCTAQRHWTAERFIRVTEDDQLKGFLQINGMELDEYGLPVMVNALGQLDVNILLDEGPDTITMMADAYDQVAQDPTIPFPIKLELMPIQGSVKRKIQGMLQPPPPNPADIAAKGIALEAAKADVEVRHSTAVKNRAGAVKSVFDAAASAAKAGLDSAQAASEGQQDAPLQPWQGQQGGGQSPIQPGEPVPAMPPAPSGVASPPQQPGVGPHLGAPTGGQSIVPPHLGARVAPDGKMYVPDPQRPGRYLMVA